MNRLIALMCFVLIAIAALPAVGGDVGVGIIAGEPSGFSLKIWLGDTSAVDAAAGWALGENEWIYVHANYLFHRDELHHPELDRGIP